MSVTINTIIRGFILTAFLFFFLLLARGGDVLAAPCEMGLSGKPPESRVIMVPNQDRMISYIVMGMSRHREYFVFYYPGIEGTFRSIERVSPSGKLFIDYISMYSGYLTGILSGYDIHHEMVGNLECIVVQFNYSITLLQEVQINRFMRNVASGMNTGTDYEKALKAHNFLASYMRYDKNIYNVYYGLCNRRGLCMVYALLYQRLMQELKVPCIYVKGNDHAWNMVKIDGQWYNVDVTWDDRSNSLRYFLVCDRDNTGHRRLDTFFTKRLPLASRSYPLKR